MPGGTRFASPRGKETTEGICALPHHEDGRNREKPVDRGPDQPGQHHKHTAEQEDGPRMRSSFGRGESGKDQRGKNRSSGRQSERRAQKVKSDQRTQPPTAARL